MYSIHIFLSSHQAMESGVKDGVRFKRKKEELADLLLKAKRDVLTGNDGMPADNPF